MYWTKMLGYLCIYVYLFSPTLVDIFSKITDDRVQTLQLYR